MKNFAMLALAAILAGCAAQRGPQLSQAELEEVNRPLLCHGTDECGKMWQRAQVWVAAHAGYQIRVATDALIETAVPPDYSMSWGFRVLRVPLQGDEQRIAIKSSCGGIPLCRESRDTVDLNFKRFVGAPT